MQNTFYGEILISTATAIHGMLHMYLSTAHTCFTYAASTADVGALAPLKGCVCCMFLASISGIQPQMNSFIYEA
jgi:hypothetical protein